MISAKPLASMNIESVVSSGLARKFITQMFATWLKVSSIGQMHTSLRKAGLDQQMHIFFPQNERSVDDVTSHFSSVGGLDEVVTWYLGQQTAEVKQEMGALITRMTTEEKTQVRSLLGSVALWSVRFYSPPFSWPPCGVAKS